MAKFTFKIISVLFKCIHSSYLLFFYYNMKITMYLSLYFIITM